MYLVVLFHFVSLISGQENPISTYIRVPSRYIAPLPTNSILKDVTNSDRMTVELCAAKCTLLFRSGNFPCYAFEYTPGSNMCIYTNITTLMLNAGYLSLKKNLAVDYYERPKGNFKNLFHEQPNTALKDGGAYYDIKNNVTVDQCAHLCLLSSKPPCLSFSYSKDMKTCGLSSKYYNTNNKQPGTALLPTRLYSHYQYFTSWACNAIIPPNYAPRAIASVRFPYQAVRNVECSIQIDAPSGHVIHITFPTIFFGHDICNSYNHGINVHDGDSATDPVIGRFCKPTTDGFNILKTKSNKLYLTYKTADVPMAFKAVYQFENACESNKCQNGATCQVTNSSYVCQCSSGWSGRFCEANIDDCIGEPCLFGGTCIDKLNGYTCQCLKEFTGKRCDVFLGLCSGNPCVNGKCHVKSRFNYTCECEKGFIGRNCEHKQEFCLQNPCVHGSCIETFGYYMCNCKYGFTGKHCEFPKNLCLDNPCVNGICSSSNGTFHCTCSTGYTGLRCDAELDPCAGVNCFHGKCISMNGTYICHCKEGFSGIHCESDVVYNPCLTAHCGKGLCETLHGNRMGYRCICPNGYKGEHCQFRSIANTNKVNPCKDTVCLNGGLCRIDNGNAICSCKVPFSGEFCQTMLNDCSFHPCHGDATCLDTKSGYYCICPRGWSGQECNVMLSPCLLNPCNHGVCMETNDRKGFKCVLFNMSGHSNISITQNVTLYRGKNEAVVKLMRC